tara:strand:- start:105 stop:650 length:546 start_codon:yes stop_codon:yes gene_type:complete
MGRNKILTIATITGVVCASTILAKEPRDKIGSQDFDTNGDGVISFLEFQERNRFELGIIDADKDGVLSVDEFLQPDRKKSVSKKPPKEFLEKKKSLATKKFEEMDTDFDGFINIDELQDAKFDAMDKNGDGVLSWKELRKKGEFHRAKKRNFQVAPARRGRQKMGEPSERRWRQKKRNHQL